MKKKQKVVITEEKRVDLRTIRNNTIRKHGGKLLEANVTGAKNAHAEFYGQSDDSEDERIVSRIGRLKTNKYQDKDFIGYDENLQKVVKKKAFEDKISEFISKTENPDWWRVVRDELNNKDVVLTDAQLHMLDKIRQGKSAKPLGFEYFEHEDFDSNNLLPQMKPKRNFLPSKWERIKINKLVDGIKQGRIKLDNTPVDIEKVYDIWTQDKEKELSKYLPPRVAPAKIALPTNVESYNPPAEYILTPEEQAQWEATEPEDRETQFLPKQFRYLRQVPSTPLLARELFNRCLDLYMCPRVRRKKLQMKSSDFLPELPNPDQLRPFPTHHNLTYVSEHDTGSIVSIAVHHRGIFVAVCYEKCLSLYDARTTRCTKTIFAEEKFYGVKYHGETLAVLTENGIKLLVGSYDYVDQPIEFNRRASSKEFPWTYGNQNDQDLLDTLVTIELGIQPKHIDFHHKGDYFVSTQPESQKKAQVILVHSISKGQTSVAFNNMKASTEVQQVIFHPSLPQLFILTKKHVFIYSLSKQALLKKLLTGNNMNSTLSIHQSGEHVLVGSLDQKVCWFDLEMGVTPFKKMQYHEKPIRRVAMHQSYPLFASASDDGTINIFYGKISTTDLSQAPVILPLKVLKKSKKSETKQYKDIAFHPSQPWIFSADQTRVVSLWT